MTKEELMELGLAEDQANKVLEKHTAELTAEQQKNTDLTAELDTAKASSKSSQKIMALILVLHLRNLTLLMPLLLQEIPKMRGTL